MFFDEWETAAKAKPVLRKELLWEYDLSAFDYHRLKGIVVARVIERGREEDFHAIFKLYGGTEKVREIIRDDVPYLSPKDMAFACAVFNLKKETLKCYTRQLLRQARLNS
jgi:hypothetical protein